MQARRLKIRDTRVLLIDDFIDGAVRDPTKAGGVAAKLHLSKLDPQLPGWRAPDPAFRRRAQQVVAQAAAAVHVGARMLGMPSLATEFRDIPEFRLEVRTTDPEAKPVPAPLVFACLEHRARYELTRLGAPYFTRHIADYQDRDDTGEGYSVDLFDADVRRRLMRHLNAFAFLEINLWWLAREGGLTVPVPYPVRYDVARYLWSRESSGHIFCLRCGSEVHFKRAPREGISRVGRCLRCSRGRPEAWPEHALEPYERATWWLKCQFPGCDRAFVGRAQARHCPAHRTSRLASSGRR